MDNLVSAGKPGDTKAKLQEDVLEIERRYLRQHLGLGLEPGHPPSKPPQTQPLFFIEMVPDSRRGANCKLSKCQKSIFPGELRLALNPSMGYGSWYKSSVDFYHVHCFENIADFSKADFLDRIQPLTRSTWNFRGLKTGSVLDGSYLVPGGVERLVLEWKVTRGRWMDKRDGVYDEDGDRLDADFNALLREAGSTEYKRRVKPQGMSPFEYRNLLFDLAPYESDGPGDTNEWSLFATYLNSTAEALDNPHDLSTMLQRWQNDAILARKEGCDLDQTDREARHQLGEKGIRALRRLSAVPMPQSGVFSSPVMESEDL